MFNKLIHYIIQYDKRDALSLTMIAIFTGIVPGLCVVVLSQLLSGLERKDMPITILSTLLLLIIMFAKQMADEIANKRQTEMTMQFKQGFRNALLQKLGSVKAELMEDSTVLNLKNRVFDKGEDKLQTGFACMLSIASAALSMLVTSAIVCTKSLLTGVLLLAIDIPVICLAYRNGKRNYVENKQATIHRRYYGYLEELQFSKEPATERKVFDSFGFFYQKWSDESEKTRKLEMNSFLKYFLGIRISAIMEMAFVFLALLLLGKSLSDGDRILFVSLAGYLISIFQIHSEQLPFSISKYAKSLEYVRDVTEFMNLEEKEIIKANACCISNKELTMEWRDVVFKYPNASKESINGISMNLRLGEHYAFVGKNGSGKSTLMKLMLGLYDDYKGSILLGGKELREWSPAELRRIFSPVFQNYAKYALSIKDNIAIGDVDSENAGDQRINDILNKMGLKEAIALRQDGINTPLWKNDDGYTDFSEGQWQRLAVGRSLYADATMRILDEPTASIDPVQEKAFFEEYEKLRENAGTILISHRLGSVKSADSIFVLDEGRIVEHGNHETLMARKGLYYEMYKEQEAWYTA